MPVSLSRHATCKRRSKHWVDTASTVMSKRMISTHQSRRRNVSIDSPDHQNETTDSAEICHRNRS